MKKCMYTAACTVVAHQPLEQARLMAQFMGDIDHGRTECPRKQQPNQLKSDIAVGFQLEEWGSSTQTMGK